jgi:16S rRNA pseudouridine516 synthase
LPVPLRRRGLQPVGRLDQDTTGLLLLTDDGPLLHKLTSPKHHVPKVYEVTCKHPVTQAMCDKLLKGVVLDDDPTPVKADAAVAVPAADGGETLHLRLTLLQGKYHQVKRMVAAVSNRVEGLHRSEIGRLTLPEDLAPGQWRWLEDPKLVLP